MVLAGLSSPGRNYTPESPKQTNSCQNRWFGDSETIDFNHFGWFWQACPAQAGSKPQNSRNRPKVVKICTFGIRNHRFSPLWVVLAGLSSPGRNYTPESPKQTQSNQNQWFWDPKPWILTTLGGFCRPVQPGPELHPRMTETDQQLSKSLVSGPEPSILTYSVVLAGLSSPGRNYTPE